jgi:protein SCO1/2
MSPQKKILFGIFSLLLAIAAVVSAALLSRPIQPPSITGVLIPDSLALKEFSLVDHNNREFTRQNLLGRWHIVSYGYTHCPDICPTTLTTLAQVAHNIEKDQAYTDVQFVFYSVDPERDTSARLAEYVGWFHEDFVGVTRSGTTDTPDRSFEQSLGISVVISPLEMDEGLENIGGYSVSHGVAIYLLNPEGNLQAVFKPTIDEQGRRFFSVEQIYEDYRKIRDFIGRSPA